MPPRNFPPPPLLANLVQTLWFVEREFPSMDEPFAVLPDSRIELVFSVGAPCYTLLGGQPQPLSPCFVTGLLDQTVTIHAEGTVRLFAARLYPWGFSGLFGEQVPAAGISLAGDGFRATADRLGAAVETSVEAGVAVLGDFLIERALKATFQQDEFVAAAQLILKQHGNLDVAELAAMTFTSPRSLRRKFNAVLGTTPKALARTARFEYVRDALWQNPDADLSQLALDAGYADQAHLQREFRQFSRCTPRQFAADMRRLPR
jgi:AraC-like DNA-binding protein